MMNYVSRDSTNVKWLNKNAVVAYEKHVCHCIFQACWLSCDVGLCGSSGSYRGWLTHGGVVWTRKDNKVYPIDGICTTFPSPSVNSLTRSVR